MKPPKLMEGTMVNEKQLLADGWLKCGVMIELAGKPKEHIEKTIQEYVEHIRAENHLHLVSEEVAETKKKEIGAEDEDMMKDLWTTFAELEFWVKEPIQLTHFCLNYMPSSVEIIEPEELRLRSRDITKFFNDLQGRLHQIDMVAKQSKSEILFLRKAVNTLLKNYVMLLLRKQELTAEQLSKFTGVDRARIEDFLDTLIDKGEIEMNDELYRVNKNEV